MDRDCNSIYPEILDIEMKLNRLNFNMYPIYIKIRENMHYVLRKWRHERQNPHSNPAYHLPLIENNIIILYFLKVLKF